MKLTTVDLASLTNEQSAISNINNNNAAIETALENTLSRDGTSPNTMAADLDMNSNRILNLPTPNGDLEPARVVDLTSAVAQINGGGTVLSPYPTFGDVNKVPRVSAPGSVTYSEVEIDTSWNLYPQTNGIGNLGTTSNKWSNLFLNAGAVIDFNSGDITITHLSDQLVFAGAANGYSFDKQVIPSNSTTITLGDATNQWSTLYLKNLGVINFNNGNVILTHSPGNLALTGSQTVGGDLGVTGNVNITGVLGVVSATGVSDGSDAAIGRIGEYKVVSGSGVALSTGTTFDIAVLALTAGDWDIRASIGFTSAATTSITRLNGSINTVSGTLKTAPTTAIFSHATAANVPNVATTNYCIGPTRISLSAPGTIYLSANATFTVAALTAGGMIEARRIR